MEKALRFAGRLFYTGEENTRAFARAFVF